jgi:hypothetical protein
MKIYNHFEVNLQHKNFCFIDQTYIFRAPKTQDTLKDLNISFCFEKCSVFLSRAAFNTLFNTI